MIKAKCIYCLKTRDAQHYSRREHVIPQCLGLFQSNNLVLHDSICDLCNQYFGQTIELALGRDSIEGLIRLHYGIKSSGHPLRKRLKMKIATGEMQGVIVTWRPAHVAGEIDAEAVQQVCFRSKNTGNWECFEPKELPSKDDLKSLNLDLSQVIAYDPITHNFLSIKRLLRRRGMRATDMRPLEELEEGRKRIPFEGQATLDSTLARAYCKICFNYLAFHVGRTTILREEFHPIRRFIRHGEGNYHDFLQPNSKPILQEDRCSEFFVTDGHLITAVLPKLPSQPCVAHFSPFNHHTYRITLCKTFAGIWTPTKIGHHFDVHTKEVSPLYSPERISLATVMQEPTIIKLRTPKILVVR